MNPIDKIKSIQGIIGTDQDGDFGHKSQAALDALIAQAKAPESGKILTGDGSYPWTAQIDGDDIVVLGARATCFGGSNDPQDSGETASGISTKANPDIQACSLPMNYTGPNGPTRRALIGSPIPMLPWKTIVRVESGGKTLEVPVIDLGPAKTTKNALDLTIAAAKFFNPSATATNFELRCDYTIIGAATFAK